MPLERMITNFRCLLMLLGVWILSGFLATGPIAFWGRYEFTSNIFNCDYYHSNQKSETSYAITLMLAGFAFPLVIMIFSYVNIFIALRKHSSRMTKTTTISSVPAEGAVVSAETKLRITVLLIFLTFLVCRTPFFVYLVFVVTDPSLPVDFLSQLSFWAIYLHSASNPFIFTFKHAEYQDTLKDIYSTCKAVVIKCCSNAEEGKKETHAQGRKTAEPAKTGTEQDKKE